MVPYLANGRAYSEDGKNYRPNPHWCGYRPFVGLRDIDLEKPRQMTLKRPRDPNQLAKSIIDIATG
jgi:hypothetical protein